MTSSASGVPPMPEEFKRPDVIHVGHFAPLEQLKFKGACGEAFKDVLKCGRRNAKQTDQPFKDRREAEAAYWKKDKEQKEWLKKYNEGTLQEGELPPNGENLGKNNPTACRLEYRELIECLHWNPDWPEQS